MVGVRKIQKEDIVLAAVDIFKTSGMDGIQARTLAKKLGCSTQPILYQFKTIEEVKEAVYDYAMDTYHKYMLDISDEVRPYRNIGRNYILFAKKEPELFKLIFMNKSESPIDNFIAADSDMYGDVIEKIIEQTTLPKEYAHEFHTQMWIFTHGIACMLATEVCDLTIDMIDDSLRSQYIGQMYVQMIKGHISQENLMKNFDRMKAEEN